MYPAAAARRSTACADVLAVQRSRSLLVQATLSKLLYRALKAKSGPSVTLQWLAYILWPNMARATLGTPLAGVDCRLAQN